MNKEIGEQIGRYYPVRVNGYRVESSNRDYLVAIDSSGKKPSSSEERGREDSFNFSDYINSFHARYVVNSSSVSEENIPYVTYDGEYLIIVENGYTLSKSVFDLRGVELPDLTRKQIEDLQNNNKTHEKSAMVSKYVPIIDGIVGRKIVSLIKPEDLKKFNEFYEKSCGYAYDKRNPNPSGSVWPACYVYIIVSSIFPQISKFYFDHKVIWFVAYIAYLLGGLKVSKDFNIFIRNHNVDQEIKAYIDFCKRISEGDLDAIRTISAEIGRVAEELKIANSELCFTVGRDLSVLDCYNDEEFTSIKQELVLLGCEYIQYRSLGVDNYTIEELFLNKLKSIEDRIDLTEKAFAFADEDVLDLLSNNCDFDENGRLKLVPITFEENTLAKGIS